MCVSGMVTLLGVTIGMLCVGRLVALPSSRRDQHLLQPLAQEMEENVNLIPQAIRLRLLGPEPYHPPVSSPTLENNLEDAISKRHSMSEKIQLLQNQIRRLQEMPTEDIHQVSRRARISAVLPPWSEFCRLLGIDYCKRFKRSTRSIPEVVGH